MKSLLTFLITSLLLTFHASAAVVVQNGLTHIHDLQVNSTLEGTIILKNTGSKEERITVYFNDLSVNCDGQISYLEPGTSEHSLFPFLSVNNKDYTMQPGEEYELIYQIKMDNFNQEVGSLWSLIMIEMSDPISKTSTAQGLEIGSKVRYAIQLIGNVGQKNSEGMTYENVSLSKDQDGFNILELSITNAGKFLVLPKTELQIFDLNGQKIKDLKITTKKVYPNNCQRFILPLTDLPSGDYKAVLVSEYQDEAIGVNIDLKI